MYKILISLLILFSFNQTVIAYEEPPTREEFNAWVIKAEGGDEQAQYDVAEAYRKGDIVKQDETEAAKWYERSANQGYLDAMFVMGFVYRGGNGMPMDKILSYMWFYLADKAGDVRANSLMNELAWAMNEDEIRAGRKKANAWQAVKEERTTKRKKREY
jgi:TPR repeat protein